MSVPPGIDRIPVEIRTPDYPGVQNNTQTMTRGGCYPLRLTIRVWLSLWVAPVIVLTRRSLCLQRKKTIQKRLLLLLESTGRIKNTTSRYEPFVVRSSWSVAGLRANQKL